MTTLVPPQLTPGRQGAEFGRGEFTIGAEEEHLLVDEENQLLGERAAPVVERARALTSVHGTVTGEIFQDQIELATVVCETADEIYRSLKGLRRTLLGSGARPLSVGVHPSAPFGSRCMSTSERYDVVVDEFGGLFRTPTAAFQVHVAMPDPDTALRVYRGLRNRLALLRALAAASPYWHGQDSGLATARSAIIRSYPRTTIPPALTSWDEYGEITDRLLAASEVPDYTWVWWDLRPQPRLGTLEVRVMDAQHSLERSAGLAALVQGLARHLAEVPDPEDLPDEIILANDFRSTRYGLDARVVVPDGSRQTLRAAAVQALDEARGMLGPNGLDRPLEAVESMLAEPSESERQRSLCQAEGMSALLADLVARTSDAATASD